MSTNNKANRLINEKSPYLLQHANNPVEWYPWNEEAFERARVEDKPIFLSIGYSTCHWCHVMERESFEDREVAEILNKNFICIKVDKEERPDIDNVYMNICQAMTGDGGWPLSIFMNYEKKPFYAGTYFPKYNIYGRIGLLSLLERIIFLWDNQRDYLFNMADEIMTLLDEKSYITEISENIYNETYKGLKNSFDDKYGGFSYAPKFPSPHKLLFLLRYGNIMQDKYANYMIEKTLESMYQGGIYDHIGFGFSRYSTDDKWLIPHFEKMLYDNALLAIAYLEYYQISRKEIFADVARNIIAFIKKEMTDKDGGFYSALDADSEGVEGKYYVWDYDEIIKVLGEDEGSRFCNLYNITNEGNFEGKNIPNLIGKNIQDKGTQEEIQRLYEYRNKRVHPFKDDKILTSWNGLMIAALAIGGRILKNGEYIDMAKKAANFIINNMVSENGELYVSYRDGEARILGFAEDYAFLIWGLIELYEVTFEEEFLLNANIFNNKFIENFWDEKNGGFFHYGKNSEKLLARPKEIYDGAIPSANSVSVGNLIRLSHLTGNTELEEKANLITKCFSGFIQTNKQACTFCIGEILHKENVKNIVIVGDNVTELINKIYDEYSPYTTVLVYTTRLKELLPNLGEYKTINDKATAYICEGFKCNPPTNNI